MENSNSKKMLTLTSSDGQEFVVSEEVAKQSRMIRGMIEENCVITNIPLTNVNAKILAKVLEYCQKHADEEKTADDMEPQIAEEASSSSARPIPKASNTDLMYKWDKEFISDADLIMLYDLLLATNYLDVQGLLHLTAQSIADLMKEKSVEQIRETFNITNDFTPEEEAEIRNEHPWAFEKKGN